MARPAVFAAPTRKAGAAQGEARVEPAPRPAPQGVSWFNSLFFRVVVLCGVLLMCLLGSVMVITRHYFSAITEELVAQANDVKVIISQELEGQPGIALADLEEKVIVLKPGMNIELQSYEGEMSGDTYTLEPQQDGSVVRVATFLLDLGQGNARLQVRMADQTAAAGILRAFKNKYMIALSSVFVLTLFLMIYFIAKTLRPLTELSETCTAISAGNLNAVSTRSATGEILALEETFNHMVRSLREKEMVEAKLRQAQRLSALGNLAAGVAHDVRNPLNAIKLLSSHALDALGGAPASPVEKPLRTIRNEVDRLENIVSSFLSLAKESELSLRPSQCDELLEECVRLFKQNAAAREVRLTSELRASSITLMLDPKQWVRAILNVLLNALEACPPGGRVRLFSRVTETAYEIEIRDDGPGLSKEDIERVFEPYYTTKPGGTGLGLSITRGIIQEHGGAIEISSTKGQGCQVLLSLPLEAARAE